MNKIDDYFAFIKSKGILLSSINPGSNEIALKPDDAIEALNLLKTIGKPVLGGDVLSEENDKLGYIIHLWGSKYYYLNWSCDKTKNEEIEKYLQRSYKLAFEHIVLVKAEAERLKMKSYIVMVIGN